MKDFKLLLIYTIFVLLSFTSFTSCCTPPENPTEQISGIVTSVEHPDLKGYLTVVHFKDGRVAGFVWSGHHTFKIGAFNTITYYPGDEETRRIITVTYKDEPPASTSVSSNAE